MSGEAGLELIVDGLAAGGDGIARDPDGRVVFVPYSAPGDRVLVSLVEEKKSFARARLLEVVEPGPGRAEPRCAEFIARRCGGCQWQHLAAATQAAGKQAIVASALRKLDVAIDPIVTPAPEYGWRRRARLHWVRPNRAERALIGLYAPRGKRIADIADCPQLEAPLLAALACLREQLAPALTGKGELELLAGHAGDVHLAVRGPCAPAAARDLVGRGPIVGVQLGRRSFGADSIELEPGMPGRADWFAQASRDGNRALLELVDEMTRPRDGTRIIELFAGAGNLTRVLADGAVQVVAIDRQDVPAEPVAPVVEHRQGMARDVIQLLVRRRQHFDLAVLDPPRTGAPELVQALNKLAPERIVYVSCDPATLARDAAGLVAGGYRAVRAQPVDLMPQTAHVEVVLSLAR